MAAMSDSGLSTFGSVAPPMCRFNSGSFTGKNGSTGLHNHPRRNCCRTRKRPLPSASSDSQSLIAFEQSFSRPSIAQSNITATEHNAESGQGKILPTVANEEGRCNSIENKEAKQELVTNSLVKISRILKGIPQSPHFYQLRNHSELARNCMISSWDWIFEETVDQIHSLEADGFWVKARDLWKTMEELQCLGYNVIPLRRRMLELSDVMTELKLHKLEITRLKNKAENHRAERSRLEFMILNLQEGMNRMMNQAEEMEKELPKMEAAFAKLSVEPL